MGISHQTAAGGGIGVGYTNLERIQEFGYMVD